MIKYKIKTADLVDILKSGHDKYIRLGGRTMHLPWLSYDALSSGIAECRIFIASPMWGGCIYYCFVSGDYTTLEFRDREELFSSGYPSKEACDRARDVYDSFVARVKEKESE